MYRGYTYYGCTYYGSTYYGLDLRHEELFLVAVGSVDAIPAVARPNVEAVGRRGRAAVPWRGGERKGEGGEGRVRARVRVRVRMIG